MTELKYPRILRTITIIMLISLFALSPVIAQSQNVRPIADAGLSRYAGQDPIILDGTGSYDPDESGSLSYSWQQISGPSVVINDANTATPSISGFIQTDEIQECEFELVVSDGELTSLPDVVRVIIVPTFNESVMVFENESYGKTFDPQKPTVVYLGGALSGYGMGGGRSGSGELREKANVIAFDPYHDDPGGMHGPNRTFSRCADMIIVFLSAVAPNYKQAIQTMGLSLGGIPAIDVALRLNKTYADSRYAVNRVTFLDVGTFVLGYDEFSARVADFLANPVDGEQCWLDSYYSNLGSVYPSALNVVFQWDITMSEDAHSLAMNWYRKSIGIADMAVFNYGVIAGSYWSVVGPGRNLQLASTPEVQTYKFNWHGDSSSGYMDFYDELEHPGRLPEPITLVEPIGIGDTNSVILTCKESENAIGYQLLLGPDPYRVMDYIVISDTPHPPDQVITDFPFEETFWTIRAYDQYGSTIYADPIRINLENLPLLTIDNLTNGRRYGSIQLAIDDADSGDEIVITEGIYHEYIDFQGKNLIVRSTDPNDSSVVAATILAGDDNDNLVTFSNNEDASCVLAGFTITGANNGIYCSGASPRISSCNIVGNIGDGMKLYMGSNPIISNCIIAGNGSSGIAMLMFKSGRTTLYNSPTIVNCTIVDNSEIGIFEGKPTVLNSIIYGNGAHITGSYATVQYSNVQGSFPGEGNSDIDPLFADAGNGDYHLKSQMGRWDPNSKSWIKDDMTSPCINAGDPNSDWSGETWPHGERINMGAYGGTKQASMSLETGGMMLPNVAFIYSHRDGEAESFQSFLEAYGCSTTLIRLAEVTATPLDSYDLIIVANDTQNEDTWSDPNAAIAIEESSKPVIGLGEGAYTFFGLLGLSIGNPYGAHGNKNSIEVIDPNSSLFSTPYSIEIPEDRVLHLYTETNDVRLYLWPTIPETITVLAREANNFPYSSLAMQHNRYLLWGFTESPQKMTEIGKTLFINVVIWTANEAWESEN